MKNTYYITRFADINETSLRVDYYITLVDVGNAIAQFNTEEEAKEYLSNLISK